jgi:hypothetical protein
MSNRARAIAIGMLGPAISGAGFAWILAKALLVDPERATFRYFIFDAPHLMIAAGIISSLLCIPIAVSVALADEAELEIPAFDAELAEEPGAQTESGRYHWSPE